MVWRQNVYRAVNIPIVKIPNTHFAAAEILKAFKKVFSIIGAACKFHLPQAHQSNWIFNFNERKEKFSRVHVSDIGTYMYKQFAKNKDRTFEINGLSCHVEKWYIIIVRAVYTLWI